MLILQQLVRLLAHLFFSSCTIVAFLLRISSLNLLYISVNIFLRYNAFTLCNGEFGMSHPALTQLRALRYFTEIPALEPQLLDWLLLEDSMTKRFEQQGKR